MTKLQLVAVGVIVLAGAPAVSADEKNKLPDEVVAALEKAQKIEVYSLTGDRADKGADAWHGYGSLGKTTLKQGDDVKKLIDAVKKGVADGGPGARCFIPRHGISVTHDGKTYDLIICFECSWIYVFEGDKRLVTVTTTGAAHKQLDKWLTNAGVKLAKPEK
jgi:hypothetical protein